MKKYVLSSAVAMICAGTLVTAQAVAGKQNQTRAQRSTQAGASASQQGPTELVGCLYRERDIPGRPPTAVGYTITNAHPPEGLLRSDESRLKSEPAGGIAPTPFEKSVPGGGGVKMYMIEKIPEERLVTLLTKRVEVTGRIAAEGNVGKGTSGRFEALLIREVPIPCPATAPAPVIG